MHPDRTARLCGAMFCRTALDVLKSKPMDASDLITIDPEILGGTPVFRGLAFLLSRCSTTSRTTTRWMSFSNVFPR